MSLTGEDGDQHPVRILRDTGGSQSVILASVLLFSEHSACGYRAVLRGIEMEYVPQPVHLVNVKSKLVSGFFPVAVCYAYCIHILICFPLSCAQSVKKQCLTI